MKELVGKGILPDQAKKYLSIVNKIKPNEEIAIIFNYLKQYGFPDDWYVFDPTIARSFSYSMGPIWEVVIPEYGDMSVLGGERYDGLVKTLSGKDIGGTGFGLGFDRTLEAIETCGLLPTIRNTSQVLVTIFTPPSWENAIQLSAQLRTEGIATELYPDPTVKLEKQLKYADKKGIPYVIVQGPDEQAKGLVQLKDMKARTNETLTINEVISKLRGSRI